MLSRRLSLAAIASFAACTMVSLTASAQTAGIVVTNPSRLAALRSDPVSRFWISQSDCIADDVLGFPVIISGVGNGAGLTLEVWASSGASCLPSESRTTAAAECWRVFSGPPSPQTQTIPIKVRDIAAMQKPPTFMSSIGTLQSCTPPAGTTSAAQPITLFFMLLAGNENQGGSSWPTKIDLVAPAAPVESALGIGDTLLNVAWTANTDPDVSGYNFFCDPPLGSVVSPTNTFGPGAGDSGTGAVSTPAVVDAGTTCTDASATSVDDSGADATSNDAADELTCTTTSTGTGTSPTDAGTVVSGSNCGSTHILQGVVPDATFAATFSCGSVAGFQATSFNITGLVNNIAYTVATSATDAVGNIGALSNVQCESPQVVLGFAQAYHSAGGTAGGGFCAMGRFPSNSGWWGGASVLVLGLGLGRRRRRPASH
jgi:hypothetical protein